MNDSMENQKVKNSLPYTLMNRWNLMIPKKRDWFQLQGVMAYMVIVGFLIFCVQMTMLFNDVREMQNGFKEMRLHVSEISHSLQVLSAESR